MGFTGKHINKCIIVSQVKKHKWTGCQHWKIGSGRIRQEVSEGFTETATKLKEQIGVNQMT